MSGVAGAARIKSRQDFDIFIKSYHDVISQFPEFVRMQPTGSYNSDQAKNEFGDIDLIVQFDTVLSKPALKKKLQSFFEQLPAGVICPFSNEKYLGRKTYNSGEIVTVRYFDSTAGYSVQIDNIVATSSPEYAFKKQFLDMPAEKQGIMLGLVKVAAIENSINSIFNRMNIKEPVCLLPDQEYEFNLSSACLQLRLVTYLPGTHTQVSKQVVWESTDYNDVHRLLYYYQLTDSFSELLLSTKRLIRNPRSYNRIKGVFGSMITVKSGEIGTKKEQSKLAAIEKVNQAFEDYHE